MSEVEEGKDTQSSMSQDKLSKTVRFPKLPRPKFFEWFKRIKKQNLVIYTILGLMAAYVIVGAVFGVGIYKYKWENKASQIAVIIYPYPAALVNGQPVWLKGIYQQISFLNHFSSKTQQEVPSQDQVRTKFVDQAIDNVIVSQQAKLYGVKVSKKDFDDAYQAVIDQSGGHDKLIQVLQELYGMKENDFKDLVNNQVLKEKLQSEVLVQIKASHILVSDEAKGNEALQKLIKKEISFSDAAKQYSQDTGSKDKGGDLGWFGRGTMDSDFEKAAFQLKPGEMTQALVKSQFGFHIITVTDKKGKVDKSFDEWLKEVKAKIKIFRFYK